MVGNDSSHHLKMFGEVSKPVSAEMSKILISGPKFNLGHYVQTPFILLSKIEILYFCYLSIILFHTMSTRRIKLF